MHIKYLNLGNSTHRLGVSFLPALLFFLQTILLMPFRYALALASIMSVLDPLPVTHSLPTLMRTVTSPMASLPPVTDLKE